MRVFNNKKIVYWGIGNICRMCLEQYPHIQPHFFIDSNWDTHSFSNIPVKKPNEVDNWSELFVVIVVLAYEDIEKVLKSKMLIKNQDYAGYKDFFLCQKGSLEEDLNRFQNFIERAGEYKNAQLIVAPVFTVNNVDDLTRFFRLYGKSRMPQKCILFSYLEVIKKEYAENVIGYPVFDIPDICRWDGKTDIYNHVDEIQLVHGNLLSSDEKKWICELEDRKIYEDKVLSFNITSEIYWYLKQIYFILQPSKVVIWDGWKRRSYILAELAKKNNIPYGFIEYGWIPGTILFDKYGIAGQSRYAVEPDKLLRMEIKNTNINIKEIRKYIVNKKLDTGRFRKDQNDEKRLRCINKQKKTVFLVGMDDYDIGINPQSNYWRQYVSNVVSSTTEAVSIVAEVCRKNGWNFVFKPHPNSPIILDDKLADITIQVHFMEIDRLIQLSDVVVSIVSKVDYKVLMHGKPLLQLGHTTLAGKGCSYEVYNSEMLEAKLKEALEKGMTQEQNKNFEMHMAQLLDNCLWDDLSEREIRYGLPVTIDFFKK